MENAVLSAVRAPIVFPAGETATRHNLFCRITYSTLKVENGRIEDNLFLDASWSSVDVDTHQGGHFRNNPG